MDWHAAESLEVIKALKGRPEGLSEEEAAARLAEYGPNTISIEKKISPLSILISQFKNMLVILLLIAAAVSFTLNFLNPHEGGYVDGLLISAIVVANAIFGFIQEYKAERSIEALARMAAPRATVIRGGKERELDAELVVPGDVILLEEGDKVPADARLLECFSLYADESSLTGESVPASKKAGVLPAAAPLAERSNMAFMNSVVTRGRARAVVVDTGLRTEVGRIAKEISEAPQKVTQFQMEIEDLGRKVSTLTLVILVVIAASEFLLRTGDVLFIFTAAVALGVAAIPEGLPAVVTLALSISTGRMLRENALMRRLSTVQDLGSVDVICTDKTGTLTENVMTVTRVWIPGGAFSVSGKGTDKKGGFVAEDGAAGDLAPLLRCAVVCNDARESEEGFRGDPTEIALLLPAYKSGMDPESMRRSLRRTGEISFSSDRKMMSTLNTDGGSYHVFAKGAPEVILSCCTHILEGGKRKRMAAAERERILEQNRRMASGALRVLALAWKEGPEPFGEDQMEGGLSFLGLMGMMDPPRAGVKEAVEDCRTAGIRVIMVTGDNRYTAEAVGRELGFSGPSYTGEDLDGMTPQELSAAVEKADIYARTSPRHKVMLLRALKGNGHIVSMTGDGVNDAAAIKNSDVGIAMGIRGTEVTKQASDIIILDDNFITIRNAIREGRGTFDNIRKFVVYLLGANISEVLIVFVASVTSLGISPKIAVQLLWINLATDGLPALALGVDPPAAGIMKRKPRKKDERIVDRETFYFLASIGICASAALLALYAYALSSGDRIRAQTLLFTIFVVFEMVAVYAVRWHYRYDLLANKWLHLSVALSLGLQLALLYSPFGAFFGVVPLTLTDWDEIATAVLGFLVLLAIAGKARPLFLGPGKEPL
jgi:Ca2+-transporting ATPase